MNVSLDESISPINDVQSTLGLSKTVVPVEKGLRWTGPRRDSETRSEGRRLVGGHVRVDERVPGSVEE